MPLVAVPAVAPVACSRCATSHPALVTPEDPSDDPAAATSPAAPELDESESEAESLFAMA